MSFSSEVKSIFPTRRTFNSLIKTDSQGLSTNLSIGGPTEIGRSTRLRSPGKYLPNPGQRSYCGETAHKKQKQQDFTYGPETTVVAVTRTAVLTEHSSIWIHASRAKLVEKGPGPTQGKQERRY
ncbi:unnamed protein product [Staurois parvus]|uniref:Uncharacterized protein n=1 Tax=Staurois parvus TaxID=386267 RepID=A0ABN9A998_9NEOB|nr:unnamed protein product [Staurois parvus]